MKPLIPFILFLFIFSFVSVKAITPSEARVDWTNGFIISDGKSSIVINDSGSATDNETGKSISYSSARVLSYQKSKEKALLNAADIINQIQVDPDTKIGNLIINDRIIRQRISNYLHEYAIFKELPAGYLNTSCRVELKLGYLIDTLNIQFPENNFPIRSDNDFSTKYTSLIIDTRGLNIKPALLPAVVNESGLEIFSRNNISGKIAVKHLAVSYTNSEREAVNHKKAGKHPFYCTALKSLNGNPVISDDDVKRIYSHKDNLIFLKKCRVIFIIDR
ncbi:MAG TPA: hypothetical protein PKZ64_13445 [Spirochaetota bacterium]|nr:hypothetical protein [Spirochaetota bacterium]